MEIISLGRQGGKTHHYIQCLVRNGRSVMVVTDEREAIRCRHLLVDAYCKKWGKATDDLSIEDISTLSGQIVSMTTARDMEALHRREVASLYVDNLDSILFDLFRYRITSASMSEPTFFTTELPPL